MGTANVSASAAVSRDRGPEARAAWNRDAIAAGLAAVETMLAHGPSGRFCHGDMPGMADCVLVPQLYNAARWGVDTAPLPRLAAVAKACTRHPAFLAAHPDRFAPA